MCCPHQPVRSPAEKAKKRKIGLRKSKRKTPPKKNAKKKQKKQKQTKKTSIPRGFAVKSVSKIDKHEQKHNKQAQNITLKHQHAIKD